MRRYLFKRTVKKETEKKNPLYTVLRNSASRGVPTAPVCKILHGPWIWTAWHRDMTWLVLQYEGRCCAQRALRNALWGPGISCSTSFAQQSSNDWSWTFAHLLHIFYTFHTVLKVTWNYSMIDSAFALYAVSFDRLICVNFRFLGCLFKWMWMFN